MAPGRCRRNTSRSPPRSGRRPHECWHKTAGPGGLRKESLECAPSSRPTRARMLAEIVLPAATPYLLAGFRLAAGRALIGAVVAEFFLSVGGLRYFILFNFAPFTPHKTSRSVP